MNEALTDYHNGVKDYSNEKILALKLAFENELENLSEMWEDRASYNLTENNIQDRVKQIKQAIKLAEGIQ